MIKLTDDTMCMTFDRKLGRINSLKLVRDPLQTEFVGNQNNISYRTIIEKNQWLGDVKLRTWDEKQNNWTLELTECSGDIRKTYYDEEKKEIIVDYPGNSKDRNGINNVALQERFFLRNGVIEWIIKVKNVTGGLLEVGEFSLPFVTNSDFTGIFTDRNLEDLENWRGIKQKLWHEKRVQIFSSVNGSSSYVLLQRPKGDYPALLFQTVNGTSIEAAYQMDSDIGCQWDCTFEGPYYLSLYSYAAKKSGKWKWEFDRQAYGINGNHSLLLNKDEERTFHFRFRPLSNINQLKDFLYDANQISIEVQPGMVAPVGEKIQLYIRSKEKIALIPVANNITIEKDREDEKGSYWNLTCTRMGQKKIQVTQGKGITYLFFYGIGDVKELLKRRSEFIITRHYYDNPQDPFHRHHAFLGFDDMVEMIFTESEESFQVAALDELGLPIPMFLAEKNSIYPKQNEIDILEEFIDDSLYGVLQQQDTYLARRSMYFEERKPSDKIGFYKFDKKESEDVERSFNYTLIANIYYGMYVIAKRYGMTKKRSAEEYLDMAYQTAMLGYQLGVNKFNGAPAGGTVIKLLEALKEEDKSKYQKLDARVRLIAEENAKSEYPFGSELYVDQTPHNQYQAMMKYYGYDNRLEEAYRVTMALRIGFQPAWFLYGNEKRGNVCCWYATALNSRVMYDGFEDTGDLNMLKLAYGGAFSFLTCIRSNGAAHGWYLFWPDRNGFDLRTLDTDMGLYGYLQAVSSYMVDDPVFGRCGYGCRVTGQGEMWYIKPYDGIGRRIICIPWNIKFEVTYGSIQEVEINELKKVCQIRICNASRHRNAELLYVVPEGWLTNVIIEENNS